MRIRKRLEERAAAKKLRALEKQQEEARIDAEVLEEEKEGARSNKFAKPEDYDNTNFIIREAELAGEKKKREDAKKKLFYETFKPDFDIDEVPPLE